MYQQPHHHYAKIEKAIAFIRGNFTSQPSLNEVAKHVNLSTFHFQRIFTEWAGVSPKKFLQYITIQYAKQSLGANQLSLFDTAIDIGMSSTGRLHDLFVKVEGMSPGEYKSKGVKLVINYSFAQSLFGDILVASTTKGICFMGFVDSKSIAIKDLKSRFVNARFKEQQDEHQINALKIYSLDWAELNTIKLHLKGTDFQLKVWESLLKIPEGKLTTYGQIANTIQKPKAARAVGTAIGANPIAFLIPCHRVIQNSGALGGYMWGTTRKSIIIGWEAAQINR